MVMPSISFEELVQKEQIRSQAEYRQSAPGLGSDLLLVMYQTKNLVAESGYSFGNFAVSHIFTQKDGARL